MSKRHESEAWLDINAPQYVAEAKKKKVPRRVKKEDAKEKFKATHSAVDIENHLRALSR